MPNWIRTEPKRALGLLRGLLIGALAIGTAGCAESIGDIDRTQPDLIAKSDFEGQWFIRQTVIDVPPESGQSFVGAQSTTEVLVWEVKEDFLFGYRAYPRVPGADQAAAEEGAAFNEQPVEDGLGRGRDPEVFKGAPIAAYAIEGHHDVIREFNSKTGEQTNVITESNKNRPWYERDYMRVDWANNQVNNLEFFTNYKSSGASFIPANEGGDNAFRREQNDDGETTYLDFVDRVWGPSGSCFASYLGYGDCGAAELKIRTSLLKVDVEREQDFVPVAYNDQRLGEFGIFRVERPTYDREFGNTFEGLILSAQVHDIWKDSRNDDGRPLAYKDRGIRPIVYTLSANYPTDLIEATEEIVADFDAAFKRTAAAARGQSVSKFVKDLKAETDGSCLFCLDKNEEGTAKLGDLRYNFISWIEDPQLASPLGYGPSAVHPQSGRIISGTAHVYGAGVDRSAAAARDIVLLLNGELKEEEITGGGYFRDAIRGGLTPLDPRASAHFEGLKPGELLEKVAGAQVTQRIRNIHADGLAALPPAQPGFETAQLKRLQGTRLEALMMPQEVEQGYFDANGLLGLTHPQQTALGFTRNTSIVDLTKIDNDDPNYVPLSLWGSKQAIEQMDRFRRFAERNNVWLQEFADPAVIGLARQLAKEGLSADEILSVMRREIYRGVMAHEIGHTVGLMHNFSGSGDPMNYHDRYWELRTLTIPETGPLTVDGLIQSNCAIVGFANDLGCTAQEDGRMAEQQYSSIMDYHGRFNLDFNGLGYYDDAAIASAYGDLVEVFDDEVSDALAPTVRLQLQEANRRLNPVRLEGQGIEYSDPTRSGVYAHYTDIPRLLGGYQNIGKRSLIPRGDWDNNAEAGPVKVPYRSCYDDFVDSVETCHRWDHGADAYEITANYIQQYKEYYIFNNFQRDRIGFSGASVLNRVASRYLLPLTNMYQHWLFNQFDRGSQNSPQALMATLAMIEGFNSIKTILSTPSYGTYKLEDGEYNLVSTSYGDTVGGDLIITPGEGRRQSSRYDLASGYEVGRRVLESGHFYDYVAALIAITSSDASVVGVGNDIQADTLRYSIPYYLVFSTDLDKQFGATYLNNKEQFGIPVVNGRLTPPSIFVNEASTVGMPIVAPRLSRFTRIRTLFYGSAFFKNNYDTSFLQRGEVSELGSGEERTPAAGFEAVEASDPESGRRYVAYRPIEDDGLEWYAADLVTELKSLVELSETETISRRQIEAAINDIEVLKGMYKLYSNPVFGN